MAILSAGILLFQRPSGGLEVLLAHPGGPFWAHRDLGAWSIPKGEYQSDETPEAAALREFAEETGSKVNGPLIPLGEARQSSGKRITAFGVEGPFDVASLKSNLFEMEWPRKSGKIREFPEIDRVEWFDADEACRRILPGHGIFLDRLFAYLGMGSG